MDAWNNKKMAMAGTSTVAIINPLLAVVDAGAAGVEMGVLVDAFVKIAASDELGGKWRRNLLGHSATLALASLQAEGSWRRRVSCTPMLLTAALVPLWICCIMKQRQAGSLSLRLPTESQQSLLGAAALAVANGRHCVTFWNWAEHLPASDDSSCPPTKTATQRNATENRINA
ncbi:ubiquitin-protein ligase 1, partial [Striga asiatica]